MADLFDSAENDTSGVGQRGGLVIMAVLLGAVLLLASLVALSDRAGGRTPGAGATVAADALALELMNSARGALVVRQLRRAYAEEVELYGTPNARDLAAFRDDFVMECAISADASLERRLGTADFDAIEAVEATTQYCEEVARIAFERARIPTP